MTVGRHFRNAGPTQTDAAIAGSENNNGNPTRRREGSLDRGNLGDDRRVDGNNHSVNEWRELAELLVELDLTIEDLESWATAPDDVAELRHREALRDEIQFALRFHHVPRHLRQRLVEARSRSALSPAPLDPRD